MNKLSSYAYYTACAERARNNFREAQKRRAIETVSYDGESLGGCCSPWRNDADVVHAAIHRNPLAIRYTNRFQDDKEMMLFAVERNGLARVWASPRLQEDEEIRAIADKNLPRYLPKSLPSSYASIRSSDFINRRIFFTETKIAESIRNIAETLFNDVEFARKERPTHSVFIRDSHVTLFQGGHLIPYAIKNPFFGWMLRAILPHSADHFFIREKKGTSVISKEAIVGQGFNECNTDQAMITAMDFNLPFKRGTTSIEGGNCFLFMSKDEQKAVIGEISLYLSMIALEEQGCFDSNEISSSHNIEPSSDSYRMARNLDFYHNKIKPILEKIREEDLLIQSSKEKSDITNPLHYSGSTISTTTQVQKNDLEEVGGVIGYRKLLIAPISEEDRIKYRDQARQLELKLQLTKARIAEELGLCLQNIGFIPQSKFHIDMELSVTPEGVVLLHDNQKTLEFLGEIEDSENLNTGEMELLARYQKRAGKQSLALKALQEKRIEILENLGVEYRLFPAVFEAPRHRSALNYCNGIFARNAVHITATFSNGEVCREKMAQDGFTYLTTGPSTENEMVFHRRFTELFQRSFPNFTLHGIPNMSRFVADSDGGIRCLTFECYPPSMDQR